MPDNITPQGQLRHPSPLIKEANTCASCKLSYVDSEVVRPISATAYHYREKPTYACHLHHCSIRLNQWCKHHKRKS